MIYDYIIAGSGCAGLSLLHYLINEETQRNKKILVLDKSPKIANDRTWCFWERGIGPFENIVHHQWLSLEFNSGKKAHRLNLKEYMYKMIRGIDFYDYVLNEAKKHSNIEFKYHEIIDITQSDNVVNVNTSNGKYKGNYVFNSTPLFYPPINTKNSLLQHFMGWEIKTDTPKFNPSVGTLMDFSVHQKHGATFMYVLPTSDTTALVEYTLFSPSVLKKLEYEHELKEYISETLNIDSLEITHEEYGVIPMSLESFNPSVNENDRIVQLGTAGGFTKASTGYTFQFIQKHCQQLVSQLKKNESPFIQRSFRDKTFAWYDRTVLDVLIHKKVTGKEVFTQMFENIPVSQILAFLANESTWVEDFQIMSKLPLWPFLTSGLKQLNN